MGIGFSRRRCALAPGLIEAYEIDFAALPASNWLTVGGSIGNATATITGSGTSTLATDGSTGLVCGLTSGFRTITITLAELGWSPSLSLSDRLVVMMETALVTGGATNNNSVELKFRNGAGAYECGVHNRYETATKIRVRAPGEADTLYNVGQYQGWLGMDIQGWSVVPFSAASAQPDPDAYTAVCGAMNWGITGPASATQPMDRATDKMVLTFNVDSGSAFTAVLKKMIFQRCVGIAL